MLFSSYVFVLLFLPLALMLFYGSALRAGAPTARLVLTAISLLFYAWWNPVYVGLMLASVLLNFSCGRGMQLLAQRGRTQAKKRLLQVGIVANLLLLGYFKYADFFIANVNALASTQLPLLNLVLPLAISFFTLTQIVFLVDVYEGVTEEKSIARYLWFVVFFPHLIAGPIVTHRELAPQYDQAGFGRFEDRLFAYGLFVFAMGLFKKVIIADSLAPLADAGYAQVASLSTLEAWYVTGAYTLQAYFDFSGYSDMAVGIGLLFGISLPLNFNSPYKANSIIQFWQRWHMSLTDLINAYLYLPLMRLRQGFSFVYSLWVTVVVMTVVGLWHGASWTFICWGVLHGLALVINHLWRRLSWVMPAVVGWLLTMLWWHLSLVMFRSETVSEAMTLYGKLWPGSGTGLDRALLDGIALFKGMPLELLTYLPAVLGGVLLLACVWLKNPHDHRPLFRPSCRYLVLTVGALLCSLLGMGHVAEFIYFQF